MWHDHPFPSRQKVIDQRIAALLGRIRPDAVPLVDSFGFLDTQLKSTLGRFDGKVYEAICNSLRLPRSFLSVAYASATTSKLQHPPQPRICEAPRLRSAAFSTTLVADDEATKNPLNGDGRPMVGWEKLSTVLDLDFLDDTAKLQRQRDPGTVSPLAQAKL